MDELTSSWLKEFASCVRERDTDRARPLFDEDCYSFGTRVGEVEGLDSLVDEQWTPIWHSTSDFDFMGDTVRTSAADDGSLILVTARWSSFGESLREGRCTFALRLLPEGGLVAVHSHFSLMPGTA